MEMPGRKNSSISKIGDHLPEAGFTLLEMTVALIIVSIVTSASILGFGQFSNKYRINETNKKIDKIENSLTIYAQRNYRLPCPADPQADTGYEINATGTTAGKCFNTGNGNKFSDVTGIIPWKELGLRKQDALDAWGNYFTYKPSPQLTLDMTDADMLDIPDGNDNSKTLMDVHDTCRSTKWFDDDGNHVNRAKAMFCCNATPKVPYLEDMTNLTGGSIDLFGWDMFTVASSQEVGALSSVRNFAELPVRVVADTNAWLENVENANYGDFEAPHTIIDGRKDVSLAKATGIAFSILSHGPNGKLAFIAGAPKTSRKLATYDAQGNLLSNIGRASELEVFNTLQISGGTTYNPKLAGGRVNKTGLTENSSDDISSYLRTDQLMSRIGMSSCLKIGNMRPFSPERTDQKIINPNRCFTRTLVPFSVQSTEAACINAKAQIEKCPTSEYNGGPPNASAVYRTYLDITLVANRPVDNSGDDATYRCAILSSSSSGAWSDAGATVPYSGSGKCYVVGYKYKQNSETFASCH